MRDSMGLQRSIVSFLDLYTEGEFSDLRIKTEGLLPEEIKSEIREAIEDTKNLDLQYRGSEQWRKCHEKWCKSPEEGLQCTQRQPFVTSLLDSIQNNDRPFFENVMILFWFFHASAYERWEDSFDFDSIGCLLHLARQVADGAIKRIDDPNQRIIMECLQDMSTQGHHAAYIENSMICNNPGSFQQHASKHAALSGLIIIRLESLKKNNDSVKLNHDLIYEFAVKLTKYLEPNEKQHKALEQVGELMKLRRTDRRLFSSKWASTKEEISQACKILEKNKNFESSSELRAHIACLAFHQNQVHLSPLSLQVLNGNLMYGFFIEHQTEKITLEGNEKYFNDLKSYLKKYQGYWIGEANLINITTDPPPDILESSLGEEHFKNVLLIFNDIQIRELSMIPEKPGPYIATLTPKLYHYALGVGMLSFDLKLDEVSVPEFYAIKHMISRHSGQYEIWSINEEGNPQRLFSHARLIDIADLIISGYSKWFLDFYKSENPKIAVYKPEPWIEVEKAWFTHFEIYRIQDEEGNQMDAEELKMHHEYAGIMSYQRADRSSLDDWVNLSVESMHLTNLALIRAHKGDLYILSENHSICYLPDDPKFVVRQYGETSKWVFLIRCLMLYCLTESHRVLAVLKSEMSRLYASEGFQHEVKLNELKTHLKELKIKRMEIQRHRVLTISILEHAVSIGVSQYADHGLLLKRAFEETGVIQIIDRLQDRTERLATIQEDITNSMVDLKASQEELSAQQLNLLLLILTSVQMVVVVDVIYRIAGEGYPKVWKFMVYVLLSLGAIWGGIRIYTILSLRRPKRRDNLKNVKQK